MSLVRTMSGTSRHRPTASQDTGYLSADDGLKRTSSRLQPPNPAYTFGSPSGGILINAARPYSNHSASSSVASVNSPSGTSPSDHASFPSASCQPTSTRTRSTESSPKSSAAELEGNRGRSTSRESTGLCTDSQNRKIRFAPLPEARPRAYSTGRNLWLEEGDDFENGVRRANPDDGRGLVVRRDGDEFADLDDDEAALDDSDSDDEGRSAGIFGSWGGSFSGRNSTDKENDPSSYTNKLLRPLSFGKRKKSSGSMNRERRLSDSGDLSLNRTETAESDASREPYVGSVPKPRPVGSGIPMRKTRTWELGEAPSTGRRANYPPVAQRSRTRGARPAGGPTIDPNFVEWGFGSSGHGAVKSNTSNTADEDDDDGSGLAWIKRRREQKKREEEEAAAAASRTSNDSRPIVDDDEEDELNSGAATPIASPAVLNPPKPAQMSGLSASRPALGIATPPADTSGLPSPLSPSSDSKTPTLPFVSAGPPDEPEDDDDEEDEDSEDDDDGGEGSDDSDLDEAELAAEEALAAEARATSKSAGSERYHSASHQSRLLQVADKAK